MKKSKGNLLFVVICILAAMFFFYLAFKEQFPYWRSQYDNDQIRKHHKGKEIDFAALQKINPDIIGWIYIPGTKIDYPLLRCKKKQASYYLNHSYRKKRNKLGGIFVQPEISRDLSNQHVVVYGHNLRTKQMFSSLTDYKRNKYRKKHPEVYIYLPDRTIRATIYSAYDCIDASKTYQTTFDTQSTWVKWEKMTVKEGYYKGPLIPAKTDQVITLSTCSNGRGSKSRFVVHAITQK